MMSFACYYHVCYKRPWLHDTKGMAPWTHQGVLQLHGVHHLCDFDCMHLVCDIAHVVWAGDEAHE